MTRHIPEESSLALIDRIPFVIPSNTMPPRDPDDEEDENGDKEEDDRTYEPPVVRERDED